MIVTTLVMASTLLVTFPANFPDLFEAKEHHYTGGQYQQKLFRYRLFVPRSLEPTECYPLLVWLHGAGPSGTNNTSQLGELDLVLDRPDHIAQYRFFILAFQCPSANPGWYRNFGAVDSREGESDDMITVNIEILRKTMREYPVDQDRVYLTGPCSGGAACWEMAMRYPELFAAVAPMGSTGRIDISRVSRLVNVPIWAFHSLHDDQAPPAYVENIVAAVRQAGGNIYLTLEPTGNHNCWIQAIQKYGSMSWMLAQRRGASFLTPQGCRPWQWWHILTLPCALLAFIRLAWYAEQRRRRASPAAVASESDTTDADFSVGPLLPECGPIESVVEGFENREGAETQAR